MKTLSFNCLVAKQSPTSSVVSFVTNAEDIEKIARITRIGRDDAQELFGFQRSQKGFKPIACEYCVNADSSSSARCSATALAE